MGLSLVVGPAHAGKVALLLDRFVAALDRDPWLHRPEPRRRRPRRARARRARAERCSRARSARSTRCSRSSPASGPAARTLGDAERNHRASAPHRRGAAGLARPVGTLRRLRRLPRRRAHRDRGEPARSRGSRPRAWPSSTRAYRAELERLGVCDRGMVRRRAVERLTSELGSWNGAPVFAYGFEDLTGAEWRLIEALAARGEVHVSLPYEPGRAAFASLSRTVADLGALAGGDIVELAAGLRRLPAAGPRSPRAPPLRRHRHAGAARQLGALPRGSRPSRHARARRRDRARARPRRHRAGGDRDRVPVARALARVDRDRLRRARRSRLDRGAAAAGGDGVRPGAALVAPLRVEQRHASRALRLPPHAVRGARPQRRRLPRGPAARARRRPRRPHGRGDDEAAHRASAADARAARRRGRAARCRAGGRARDGAERLRPRLAARHRGGQARPPRCRGRGRDPRRARAAARRPGSRFAPRTCSRRSTGPPSAATQPASPVASRCSTSRVPARAASRRSS